LESIRRIRTLRGMNQVELAKASGVAQNTISEIETGRREARPATLRKLADALGVEIADFFEESTYPKDEAPPSSQLTLNGLLDEEWRAQHLGVWKRYLSGRVTWCEKVLQKSPEEEWNNPFLTLDSAIQWAIYVGIESTQLRNIVQTEVLPYANADEELVAELRTLLDRFRAVEDQTDARVRTMMDEAGLSKEEKKRRLRVIEGAA
jgi:transcriptional regulator with XRE-family HTH domain